MDIKVLEMGCCSKSNLYELVGEVVKELELETNVEKVVGMENVLKYGVINTPALLVDGKILVQGLVPKKDELKKMLQN